MYAKLLIKALEMLEITF